MFYDLTEKSEGYRNWPHSPAGISCQRQGQDILFPVTEHSMLVNGKIGRGKTTVVKEFVSARLLQDLSLRVAFFESKPKDFSGRFMEPDDKMIAEDDTVCRPEQIFRWGMVKEIRDCPNWETELNQLGSILFEDLMEDPRNRLWAEGAKRTFMAFIRTILYCYGNNPSNAAVIRSMRNMSRMEFLEHLAKYPGNHSMLRNYFEYDPDHTDDYVMPRKGQDIFFFLEDILGRFKGSFLSEDGTDTIAAFLAGEYGRRLFFSYDYSKKDSLIPFFRYFLKKLILEKLSHGSRKDQSLMLVLDEISELEHDFSLMQGVTVGREYGLQVILSTQSLEKIYSILPEKHGDHYFNAALAGFPVLMTFQPGDPQSIEVLQKLFGKERRQTLTMPLSRYDKPMITTELQPIVRDEDFASLDVGECYVKFLSALPERISFFRDKEVL